jgi:hypothetical protein
LGEISVGHFLAVAISEIANSLSTQYRKREIVRLLNQEGCVKPHRRIKL